KYVQELHACWTDTRAFSGLTADGRALAAMHEAPRFGLGCTPPVESAIASLIVPPDEALRTNALRNAEGSPCGSGVTLRFRRAGGLGAYGPGLKNTAAAGGSPRRPVAAGAARDSFRGPSPLLSPSWGPQAWLLDRDQLGTKGTMVGPRVCAQFGLLIPVGVTQALPGPGGPPMMFWSWRWGFSPRASSVFGLAHRRLQNITGRTPGGPEETHTRMSRPNWAQTLGPAMVPLGPSQTLSRSRACGPQERDSAWSRLSTTAMPWNSLSHLMLGLSSSLESVPLYQSTRGFALMTYELGRMLSTLVHARRQLCLVQSPLTEPCRRTLRALPLVPGELLSSAALEALERTAQASRTLQQLAGLHRPPPGQLLLGRLGTRSGVPPPSCPFLGVHKHGS
ncbi:hypothetical protein GOODEAATRI_030498, partial [Goodea atripinnis]